MKKIPKQDRIEWGKQYLKAANFKKTTLSDKILTIYKQNKYKNCLEIGAGRGIDAEYLRTKKVNILAIDSDGLAVKLMKKRFPKLHVKQKDLFKSRFDNKYDLIYSQGLIEHLNDELIALYFERNKDLLNKKGTIIVDFPPTHTFYAVYRKIFGKIMERDLTKNKIIRIAEKNGLKFVKKEKRDSFPRIMKNLPFSHINITLMFRLK